MNQDKNSLQEKRGAEAGFFDNLASAVDHVGTAVASAAKAAVGSVSQATQFAVALQPLVEANGGSLTGEQLRVLLERDDSVAMRRTSLRRDRFVEEHGREAWDRHVEAVEHLEAGPDGVRVNAARVDPR